jgi:hypothetical protein
MRSVPKTFDASERDHLGNREAGRWGRGRRRGRPPSWMSVGEDQREAAGEERRVYGEEKASASQRYAQR